MNKLSSSWTKLFWEQFWIVSEYQSQSSENIIKMHFLNSVQYSKSSVQSGASEKGGL